ncbi:hypothetical protein RhiirA4_418377 [Rhizophagus irregularis]|uniref:Uncharacterized protein n=1 Tax=Rhizophagus irregularis TaxID=588596 RepID=A0A2I1GAB9_9GLOM|nr:hypothetical protein RhiirA4_418377 [Rhizophagus irregularis]
MDSKKCEKYFDKDPKEWSLVDFDSWALNNVEYCQKSLSHRLFYKYLGKVLQESPSRRKIKVARKLIGSKKEDLKSANLLWVTPKELKKINGNKVEEEERTLSLEERKLALRERAAKVRSLELHNIQLENELGLGSEGGREG